MAQRIVNCPQCGKSAVWHNTNPFRPFCSDRCKTMDLAQWAQESYRIPEPEQPSDEDGQQDSNSY